MSKLGSVADLQERLEIAERAIADAAARISELTHAIGEIASVPEEGGNFCQAKPIIVGADTVSPFFLGFYQREYDSADRPYRWTGRGNLFELRFPVNRSFGWDFSMELQQNAYVDTGALRGFVDYLEIPLSIALPEAIVRGTVPPRPFGRQAVLTFLLPNLFVPNQINPESTDTRTLGVVFYDLRAVPTLLNDVGAPLSAEHGAESGSVEKIVSRLTHEPQKDWFLRKARTSLGVARPKKLY